VNEHIPFEEDIDLFALGTMEGEERRALEAHLESCPECARKVEEARGRVAMLTLAAPPESVPSRTRARLLRRVRGEEEKPVGGPTRPLWGWLAPVLTMASLVLAAWSGIITRENRDLRHKLSILEEDARRLQTEAVRERTVRDLLTAPDTLQVALASGTARPVPGGKAFYHPQKGLLFYAANLPALPPNQTYQLWLVPKQGNPISAGLFHVDAHGNGQVVLPDLPRGVAAAAFAVTIEPGSGMPQPTGPKVLIGTVS
jgi:anti-sigma-K factor RskA